MPDAPIRDLKVFDLAGNEIPVVQGLRPQSEQVPQFYSLSQNYPNPFNPSTTIKYALPAPTHVELKVYNVLGQMVKVLVNEDQKAGQYSVVWDGTNPDGDQAATGVYFYQLKTGDFTTSRKMMLLK
jgi:hypothetical protein